MSHVAKKLHDYLRRKILWTQLFSRDFSEQLPEHYQLAYKRTNGPNIRKLCIAAHFGYEKLFLITYSLVPNISLNKLYYNAIVSNNQIIVKFLLWKQIPEYTDIRHAFEHQNITYQTIELLLQSGLRVFEYPEFYQQLPTDLMLKLASWDPKTIIGALYITEDVSHLHQLLELAWKHNIFKSEPVFPFLANDYTNIAIKVAGQKISVPYFTQLLSAIHSDYHPNLLKKVISTGTVENLQALLSHGHIVLTSDLLSVALQNSLEMVKYLTKVHDLKPNNFSPFSASNEIVDYFLLEYGFHFEDSVISVVADMKDRLFGGEFFVGNNS